MLNPFKSGRLGQAIKLLKARAPGEALPPADNRLEDLQAGPWATPDWLRLGKQSLFIIGHARSGTTVLQNALNGSDEIYLFGEANFYLDEGLPDFRERYNKSHASNGNQPNKSTICPAAFEGDARWCDYLFHLSHLFRFVGEKIVMNPEHQQFHYAMLMDFMAARFYDGHFIFCFRNPVGVLVSVRAFQSYLDGTHSDCRKVLISYLLVMRLYCTMVRLFPNVHAVFHEDPSAECFGKIGESLGIDLSHVSAYYDNKQVYERSITDLPEEVRERVAEAEHLYTALRELVVGGISLPQIEQNRFNISPTHLTPLGSLYSATEHLLGDLGVS
jgi:hypothetical protein